MYFFLFSYGASQQRPCVRIGLTHAYLSHVKMTLANAMSVNRQTLENVVRNAASEFTRRTAIASLASLSESSPHNRHVEGQTGTSASKSALPLVGRREKTPTPKTRVSIWTLLRTPGRFTTRPLPVYFTTKMSVVRPFSVLSKDEIGP